jgi:hypothetical protein
MNDNRTSRGEVDADEAAFLMETGPFAETLRARFGGCPQPAAIRARGVDALPPEAATRLDEHLSRCPACRALADAFADVSAEPDDMLRERIWHRISRTRDAQPARAGSASRFVPYAVAASLALIAGLLTVSIVRLQNENRRLAAGAALAGDVAAANAHVATLESQVAELQRRPDQASSPSINVPIVDLAADATRGAQAKRTITLPRDARTIVFVLTVPAAARAASYALDVADRDQRVLLRLQDLRATAERTINLVLPRSAVPDGQLRLWLYGIRDQRQERVAEYAVIITTD